MAESQGKVRNGTLGLTKAMWCAGKAKQGWECQCQMSSNFRGLKGKHMSSHTITVPVVVRPDPAWQLKTKRVPSGCF